MADKRKPSDEGKPQVVQLPIEWPYPEGLTAIWVGEFESVLIATDKYEAIRETAAILGDKKLAAVVRKGMRQAEQGKTLPWDEAKKRLGL